MFYDPKALQLYSKRRHKLYKSINKYLHVRKNQQIQIKTQIIFQNSKNQMTNEQFKQNYVNFLNSFLSENFNLLEALDRLKKFQYIKKHQINQFINNIFLVSKFISGHKIAYILYKFCKLFPVHFHQVNQSITKILKKDKYLQNLNLEEVIFRTNLFIYGFKITSKFFIKNIFPNSQKFILDFTIKLPPFIEWQQFLAKRYIYKMKSLSENWINEKIKLIQTKYKQILIYEDKIQQIQVNKKIQLSKQQSEYNYQKDVRNEIQIEEKYQKLFNYYQQQLLKLIYLERDQNFQHAKQKQTIKKQCQLFQPEFILPELLHKLYVQKQLPKIQIKSISQSKILNLFDDQAFISQLRKCQNIENAIDLSSYFIQQLNTDKNRQNLIQFVIDHCHYDFNIDLIMKILAQINTLQESISELLNRKAQKITNHIKINKKYINLLCQGIKHSIIDPEIMLNYVQKRLTSSNGELNIFQTVKQSSHILQLLGQSIYHKNLKIHIKFNNLLNIIQNIIHKKKLGIDHLFSFKCLKTYLNIKYKSLKNNVTIYKSESESQTLTQLLQFNLKQHFDLILGRVQQLISSKSKTAIQQIYNKSRLKNYIIHSIQTNNYIQTFYQASLLKQINNKQLKQEFIDITINKIKQNIKKQNIQISILWSRFLGQLYNYELLNRKKLAEILQLKILYYENSSFQSYQQLILCIIECLKTSKSYILQSQLIRLINQHILAFLFQFKKSILKYLNLKQKKLFDNMMIQHQIQQLLTYFHQCLFNKFKSVEQIDVFLHKVKFSSPKDNILSLNLYKIVDYYQKCNSILQFDPTLLINNHSSKLLVQGKNNENNIKKLYKQKQKIIDIQIKYNNENINNLFQINNQFIQFQQRLNRPQFEQQSLDKQMIKKQEQNIQNQLKQMMGFYSDILDQQIFPSLNQKNVRNKDQALDENFNNNLEQNKIKKIKILTRKNLNKINKIKQKKINYIG